MRNLILIGIFFSTSLFYTQELTRIDSLKKDLKSSKNDVERFENFDLVIRHYLSISMDSSKIYNDKLLNFAKNTKNQDIAIKAYNLASSYYYYNSQLDSSLLLVKKSMSLLKNSDNHKTKADLYRKLAILSRANLNLEEYERYSKLALEEAKKDGDWKLMSGCLIVNGNMSFNKNDYSNALKHYLAIDSLHTINNEVTTYLSVAYENISMIYSALNNNEAIKYLDKSIEVHKKLDNKAGIYNSIRLKGNFYNAQKNYAKSIDYFTQTVPFYTSFNQPNKLIEVYSELALAYIKTQDYDKAEEVLKKGIKITSDKEVSKFNLNSMQYSAAMFYLHTGDYEKAIHYFKLAEKTLPSGGTDYYLSERKLISDGLSKAYEALKDFKNAFYMNERLLVLSDSLHMMNKEKLTTEIEAKYQTQRKEQEIKLLAAENKAIETQKNNQRNLFIAGFGVFLIAAIFLFLALRNRQKTNKKLKELDTVKSRFFENISHEFRTPLSLINGPIEEQLKKEGLDPQEKRHLNIAKNNSKRLLTLVDQILDLSRLESDHYKLHVQELDAYEFLKATLSSFEYQAEIKNQKFISTIDLDNKHCWFDRDVLEKVITNVLSNAIKYTPKGGEIMLIAQIQQSSLQLEVKNTGAALTKKELTHIFSRFHRAHEDTPGTGIGLALTKELVELHKGSINVSSDSYTTSFLVSIPIEEKIYDTDEKKYQEATAINFSKTETKVPDTISDKEIIHHSVDEGADDPILLIVDDTAELREYLSSLFSEDFTIKTAKDGKEGFEKAIKYVPDVIITDLMMPNEDGLQFIKKSKTHQTTSHIPIAMLTAKAGDEDKLAGIEIGADAYVTKPFSTEILKATTKNLLDSRKKLQERFSQEVILTPKEISVNTYDKQFLNHVQEVMDTNLVESDFSAENFAVALGMSRMQLHRKLKALTGLSTTEFIRSQRLKLAAQLLKKSEINISQVGYAVGFNDHSYFTKCFKKQYGMSPSDFSKP